MYNRLQDLLGGAWAVIIILLGIVFGPRETFNLLANADNPEHWQD